MHRCLLTSVVVTVQLAACFCHSVGSYPSASQQNVAYSSLSASSLQDSDEDFQSPPPAAASAPGLPSYPYRPRLFNLLQLGLLSPSLRQNLRQASTEVSMENDSDEDLQLDKRMSRIPKDSLESSRRRLLVIPTKMPPKKSGLNLVRSEGPHLSINNPLDVLRNKMILDMYRNQAQQNQRAIAENTKYLEDIGKRSVKDYANEDGSFIRPNHQRLSQILSLLTSEV